MSELKPCPFCGDEARAESYDPYDGYQGRCAVWRVKCVGCQATIRGLSKEAVIAAWNKRYYSEDAAAEAMRILDSLKEKLQKMRDIPEDRRAE